MSLISKSVRVLANHRFRAIRMAPSAYFHECPFFGPDHIKNSSWMEVAKTKPHS